MNDPQMEKNVTEEEKSCPNCEPAAVAEEKICCTRCATEIPGVDAVCPACGFIGDETRKQKISSYFYIYCIGMVVVFLNSLMILLFPNRPLFVFFGNLIGGAVNMIVVVFTMMFLYQCWCLIPKKDRFAWPGQYVGFLFVPFYQLYWMFPAYYGLVKRQNALLPEEKKGNQGIVLAFLILPYVFVMLMSVTGAVIGVVAAMNGKVAPHVFQSPLFQWFAVVIYGIPMYIISILAMFQIKKGACSLIELPPEEKSRIMKSVPGAPGTKKVPLWPVWTTGGCGCLLFIVLFSVLIGSAVFLALNVNKIRQIQCTANLKQIGLSLKMYAAENRDQFPPYNGEKGLDVLVKKQFLDAKTLSCSMKDKCSCCGKSGCFYIYLGGLGDKTDPNTMVAFCGRGVRSMNGRLFNVLYADGSVRCEAVSGKTGYAELFRKCGILDARNAFTERGRKLPAATRDYILLLLKEK